MSRFTKLPYTLSNSHASQSFELVHIDTWGPYKICTKQKYKYFLTQVDDNSRMTWVYLLQNKSYYGATLQDFCSYVENHFHSSIKTIRTDYAPEFSDKFCIKFMREHGIVHQTTCSHRPQQNARVERKHRHILEVARALKLQSGLPNTYWGDCVLASTYIINIIPFTVLNNVSPYEVLFKEPPNYSELKVFGCLAMATPPGVITNKFKPRTVPCVFVGYPASKRGYKLLNLDSMTFMVSRDVHFHEHIFTLLDGTSTPYLQPVPLTLPQRKFQTNDQYEDLFPIVQARTQMPTSQDDDTSKMMHLTMNLHLNKTQHHNQ